MTGPCSLRGRVHTRQSNHRHQSNGLETSHVIHLRSTEVVRTIRFSTIWGVTVEKLTSLTLSRTLWSCLTSEKCRLRWV